MPLSDCQSISIHIGLLGNSVGVHYWNRQTPIVSSENLSASFSTYLFSGCNSCPRLQSFSFDESPFRSSMPKPINHAEVDVTTWGGSVQRIVREDIVRCDSKSNDTYDAMVHHLDPLSIWTSDSLSMNCDDPLKRHYNNGRHFTSNRDLHERMGDALRREVEKCDRLESFVLFADMDGVASGFSSSYVETIKDEYAACDILGYLLTDGVVPLRQTDLSVCDRLLCLASLQPLLELVFPIDCSLCQQLPTDMPTLSPMMSRSSDYQHYWGVAAAIDTFHRPRHPGSSSEGSWRGAISALQFGAKQNFVDLRSEWFRSRSILKELDTVPDHSFMPWIPKSKDVFEKFSCVKVLRCPSIPDKFQMLKSELGYDSSPVASTDEQPMDADLDSSMGLKVWAVNGSHIRRRLEAFMEKARQSGQRCRGLLEAEGTELAEVEESLESIQSCVDAYK